MGKNNILYVTSQFSEVVHTDELHSIYLPLLKYYKHQMLLYNKQLLNKWLIKHVIVC